MPAASTRIRLALVFVSALQAGRAYGRTAGDSIRLAWEEGDVAGTTTILAPDDHEIGVVEYRQVRRGDRLSSRRVARFADGSSDEDEAEAIVAERLEAISGRSVVRDADGEAIVDVTIDVRGGRISGTVGRDAARREVSIQVAFPPATYWGPLVFIALKNFAANAEDGRLVFRTVAPTPTPRVFDMVLTDAGPASLAQAGVTLDARRFTLAPTLNWAIDPIIRLVVPEAAFFLLPGDPPALARFTGPRNFNRQPIRIQ